MSFDPRGRHTSMSNVVVTEFLALDGVMEEPGNWSFPYWNDEIAKFKLDELRESDSLLLGRVTYEGFAKAWPSQTDEAGFADKMNSLPKFVVSTTLKDPEWNNSTVIGADEIEKLDGTVVVHGSATLVDTLFERDLVDELRLLVYPLLLGSGKRLFPRQQQLRKLALVETRSFDSGVVLLRYRRAA